MPKPAGSLGIKKIDSLVARVPKYRELTKIKPIGSEIRTRLDLLKRDLKADSLNNPVPEHINGRGLYESYSDPNSRLNNDFFTFLKLRYGGDIRIGLVRGSTQTESGQSVHVYNTDDKGKIGSVIAELSYTEREPSEKSNIVIKVGNLEGYRVFLDETEEAKQRWGKQKE